MSHVNATIAQHMRQVLLDAGRSTITRLDIFDALLLDTCARRCTHTNDPNEHATAGAPPADIPCAGALGVVPQEDVAGAIRLASGIPAAGNGGIMLRNREAGRVATPEEQAACEERALQILSNPYASPEQVAWAMDIAPPGFEMGFWQSCQGAAIEGRRDSARAEDFA